MSARARARLPLEGSSSGPFVVSYLHVRLRADALGRIAECALADLDRGTAGDRYQVVLHVEAPVAETVAEFTTSTQLPPASRHSPAHAADAGDQAALELNDCAVWVSAETSRRLACDASLVVMQHGRDGSVLDVGRRRRTIPPAIRRALAAHDGRCRFPGCTARRCDAHHIQHWIDGGRTSLQNTALLCRTHHRAVHEGGFTVVRESDGTLAFYRPDGARLDPAPPLPACSLHDSDPLGRMAERLREAGVTIDARTCMPRDGQPIAMWWAIDVLRIPSHDIDGSPPRMATKGGKCQPRRGGSTRT